MLQLCGKEKAMAPHSNPLAREIPWTEEPGGLQAMGSRGVGHDWATSLSLFTFMPWRRKWHPTPVFLPGESQGRGSLVGCGLWGRTELDTTAETLQQQQLRVKECQLLQVNYGTGSGGCKKHRFQFFILKFLLSSWIFIPRNSVWHYGCLLFSQPYLLIPDLAVLQWLQA